ncbi:hypothetical protein BpHYR1_039982 [Brachionus plicatilis]|uniref:Uncharacterized protein n=1 Tax=Brachionus plicatilis TaxID=10195 RepID=A0A3M7SIB1_BRAPC|nr:hypothetical protein BpHYR1_039982 [Brachionus plicatilis]
MSVGLPLRCYILRISSSVVQALLSCSRYFAIFKEPLVKFRFETVQTSCFDHIHRQTVPIVHNPIKKKNPSIFVTKVEINLEFLLKQIKIKYGQLFDKRTLKGTIWSRQITKICTKKKPIDENRAPHTRIILFPNVDVKNDIKEETIV